MAAASDLGTRLYAIADAECLGTDPRNFAACVAAMVRGGVRLVQLRLKPVRAELAADDGLRCEIIEETIERTLEGMASESRDVQLWLDDRADLAAVFPQAFVGVHVGQDDLPPTSVRRLLAAARGGAEERKLVGLSCHDSEQVRRADSDESVDWVAIGPVYSTDSKTNVEPVVGLGGVRAARAATSKPLVAIGGVAVPRIAPVLEAGADAAVVLSALVADGRSPAAIERAARRLVASAEAPRSA